MTVTNSIYSRSVGRFAVSICDYGVTDPSFHYGADLEIFPPKRGINDRTERHILSLEDVRELHYLTGRALAVAEDAARKALGRRS